MQILKGHLAIKPVRSLAFAPDGTRLASSARDYKTFLWDLGTGKHQVIDTWNSYTVAFAPDGRHVATGRGYGLSVWSADTGELRTIEIKTDHGHGIHVAYAPDGKLIATASGSVRLFDAATLAELELGPGRERGTNSLAFSRDGRTLATGHSVWPAPGSPPVRFVRLWDVATRQEKGRLTGLGGVAEELAFSPDGRFLAAAAGRTLFVWAVATGEIVLAHKGGTRSFKDVAFTPDGRFLAFVSNDASARLLDVGGWREAAAFDWKLGPLISLAVAPDSMRAAAGSGKGKIVVWDLDL
jgi:Tol biopolymer transport system component